MTDPPIIGNSKFQPIDVTQRIRARDDPSCWEEEYRPEVYERGDREMKGFCNEKMLGIDLLALIT